MTGKKPVFASDGLAHALDGLSKNTLIDILVDRSKAELGEDASDDAIADLIQGWLGPVARMRNMKPVSLADRMSTWGLWVEKRATFAKMQQEWRESHPEG